MADELSEGDIVLVDFESWTDEGDLFDTTRPKVAEEAGWDTEVPLEPMPVLLGGGRVVPGFEQALLKASPGEEGEVDVPPAKGFGEHDGDKVRVFSRKEFEKADIDPIPGERVEISNQRGTIVQATASRVRVDFNHPMAGRTLTYKYKVLEKVEGDEDKLRALIQLDYGVLKAGDFEISVDGDKAVVRVPEDSANDPQWFMAKHRLGHDIFEHTDIDEIELVETVTREEFESHGHGHGHAGMAADAAAAAGAEHATEDPRATADAGPEEDRHPDEDHDDEDLDEDDE